MYKWILLLALVLFSTDASARLEEMHFVEEVRGAQYAIAGKPVKIESFRCGLNVRVEIIHDFKGNAPEFIDVGIVAHLSHPVVADNSSTYFMVISKGKTRYGYGNTLRAAYESKGEEEQAKQKIADCDAKLPDHTVNHWVMGQIIGSKWLIKPIYLAVPGHINSLVYYANDIDIIKGTVKGIGDDVFSPFPEKEDSTTSVTREKFQGLGDPNSDFIPIELQYGVYYNWKQLKQVWLDAENTCNPEHATYDEESCKLQNEDYRRQKDKEKRLLEQAEHFKRQGCKCDWGGSDKPYNIQKKERCRKACGIEEPTDKK